MKKDSAKILLAEDKHSMVTLIKYNLEKEGYTVYFVKNGKEALQFCSNQIPDLIICDIMMPIMNGLELREHILKDAKLRHIPFIFLTAKAQTTDQIKGRSLGVDEYLTKPFEPKDLIVKVKSIIEKHQL